MLRLFRPLTAVAKQAAKPLPAQARAFSSTPLQRAVPTKQFVSVMEESEQSHAAQQAALEAGKRNFCATRFTFAGTKYLESQPQQETQQVNQSSLPSPQPK